MPTISNYPQPAGVVCIRCLICYGSRKPGELCGDRSCRTHLHGSQAQCAGLLVPVADLHRIAVMAAAGTPNYPQLSRQVRIAQGLQP